MCSGKLRCRDWNPDYSGVSTPYERVFSFLMVGAYGATSVGRFQNAVVPTLYVPATRRLEPSSGGVDTYSGDMIMPSSVRDSAHLHSPSDTCFADTIIPADTNHHTRPKGISDPVYGNRKRQLSSVNDSSGNDLNDVSPVNSNPLNSGTPRFEAPVQGAPFSDTTEAKSIQAWLTASEIAAAKLPGLPFTARSVRRLAKRLCWHKSYDAEGRGLARQRRGRGGGLEYHISLLPLRARAVFLSRAAAETGQAALKEKGDTSGAGKPVSDTSGPDMLVSGTSPSGNSRYREMWAAFERLPEKARDIAFGRLAVLTAIEVLMAEDGFMKDRAIRHMAQIKGLSRATLFIWFKRIRGVPREHWLPFLMDRRAGNYAGNHSGAYSASYSDQYSDIRGAGKQLGTGPCPKKQNGEKPNDEHAGDRETPEPSLENHGAVHAGTPAVSASPCMDKHGSKKQAGDTQSDKRSGKLSGLTGTSSYSARLGTGAEDHDTSGLSYYNCHLTSGHSVATKPRRRACPDAAFELLKADWLRYEKPSFMSCYRRLEAVAARKGWALPCARSLYRQIMEDVPVAVKVLSRDGPSALKRLYPAQQRDRSVFHAMEAVNADGHVWDVFVNWPGEKKTVRPVMVAIQDLYSGKILAWRMGRRETTGLVLLAFMDLLRGYGIPAHAWFDNGRTFRGKRLVGGLPQKQTSSTRNSNSRKPAGQKVHPWDADICQGATERGKSLLDERHGSGSPLYGPNSSAPDGSQPDVSKSGQSGHGQNHPQHQTGILPLLGVRVHRTLPYSGQSKPIERAFRDFCDTIAKHPLLAGAYTGNSPGDQPANYGSRAVPIELFRSVVEEGIKEHNARPGRRSMVCGGKLSFDQAFEASFYGPGRTVSTRKATVEQRALCLPSVVVRLDTLDGSLRLAGKHWDHYGGYDGSRRYWPNRYWSAELLEHRGCPVTVRFDPDHDESVRVYGADGGFLCTARLLRPAGFDDAGAAGAHARARQAFMTEAEDLA